MLISLDYPPEYREQCPDIKNILQRNIRNHCNRNLILDRLPIVKWLPKYQWNYLFQDVVAGLTVGLTAIPQGIAYAVVAGLEPQVNAKIKKDFIAQKKNP